MVLVVGFPIFDLFLRLHEKHDSEEEATQLDQDERTAQTTDGTTALLEVTSQHLSATSDVDVVGTGIVTRSRYVLLHLTIVEHCLRSTAIELQLDEVKKLSRLFVVETLLHVPLEFVTETILQHVTAWNSPNQNGRSKFQNNKNATDDKISNHETVVLGSGTNAAQESDDQNEGTDGQTDVASLIVSVDGHVVGVGPESAVASNPNGHAQQCHTQGPEDEIGGEDAILQW